MYMNPRLVSGFYAQEGALITSRVLMASEKIPAEIRDMLAKFSHPTYVYETVYRNGMSNRVARELVQEGITHTKRAFTLLVAARLLDKETIPESAKPLVDGIWQLLKEYCSRLGLRQRQQTKEENFPNRDALIR